MQSKPISARCKEPDKGSHEKPILIDSDSETDNDTLPPIEDVFPVVRSSQATPSSSQTRRPSSSYSHGSPTKPASSPLKSKAQVKNNIKEEMYTIVDLTGNSDEDESTPRSRRRTQRPTYSSTNPVPNSSERLSKSPIKPLATPKQARPGPGPSTSAFRKKSEPTHTEQSTTSTANQSGSKRSKPQLGSPQSRPLGTWGNPVPLSGPSHTDEVLGRPGAGSQVSRPTIQTISGGSQICAKQELVSPAKPRGTWGNPTPLDGPEATDADSASRGGPLGMAKDEVAAMKKVTSMNVTRKHSESALDPPPPSIPPKGSWGNPTHLDDHEPDDKGMATDMPAFPNVLSDALATSLPPSGSWGNPAPLDRPQQDQRPLSNIHQRTPSAPSISDGLIASSSAPSPAGLNAIYHTPSSARRGRAEPLFLPSSTPSVRGSSVRPDESSDAVDKPETEFEEPAFGTGGQSISPAPSRLAPVSDAPQPGTWGNFIHLGPTDVPARIKRAPSADVADQVTAKRARRYATASPSSSSYPAKNGDTSPNPLEQTEAIIAKLPVLAPAPSQPVRRAPTWVTQSRVPTPKPVILANTSTTAALEDLRDNPVAATQPDTAVDVDAPTDYRSSPSAAEISSDLLQPGAETASDEAVHLQGVPHVDGDILSDPPTSLNHVDSNAPKVHYLDALAMRGQTLDDGQSGPKHNESRVPQPENSEMTMLVIDPTTLTQPNDSAKTETWSTSSRLRDAALDFERLTEVELIQMSGKDAQNPEVNATIARLSPAPSSVPSIQELSPEKFRPTVSEHSPLSDTPFSGRPPNMSALEYLRMRVRNRNQKRRSATPVNMAPQEARSIFAPTAPASHHSDIGHSSPDVDKPASPSEADQMSRAEWRRIAEGDGASDVEILLDGDSGQSSDRPPYDDMVENQLCHGTRLHDPTQSPPPDRRGVAKRQFDSRDIDEWNDRAPYFTKNPALHRVIFESYIQQKELESGPIGVINNIDSEGAPPDMEFEYSNEMLYNLDVPDPEKGLGCGCDGPCDPNSRTCTCLKRQKLYFYDIPEKGFAYNKDGTAKNLSIPIWECGETCGCPPECMNRVIQRGRSSATKLELVKTRLKGWGVQAKDKIPMGTFIGIYSGEVITEEESELRGELYSEIGRTYLFDLDGWQIANPPAGLHAIDPRLAEIAEATAERAKSMMDTADPTVVYNAYSVDAFHYGLIYFFFASISTQNYTRFFNHSCDPNLEITQCYVKDFHPERPLLVIFARRDIAASEELCISYKGINDDEEISEPVIERKTGKKGKKRQSKTSVAAHMSAKDKTANAKMQRNICYCKAPNCDGQMFRL